MDQSEKLMKASDALITSYVERLVLRALCESSVRDQSTSLAYYLPLVEFMSQAEWQLLKVLISTEDDRRVISYIEGNIAYMRSLVRRHTHYNLTITPNGKDPQRFCVINLETSINASK